jgi:phosphoribosylaminoimidazole-succinocarboxamide synthase
MGAERAAKAGANLADTKFDPAPTTDSLVLIDEVLTP